MSSPVSVVSAQMGVINPPPEKYRSPLSKLLLAVVVNYVQRSTYCVIVVLLALAFLSNNRQQGEKCETLQTVPYPLSPHVNVAFNVILPAPAAFFSGMTLVYENGTAFSVHSSSVCRLKSLLQNCLSTNNCLFITGYSLDITAAKVLFDILQRLIDCPNNRRPAIPQQRYRSKTLQQFSHIARQ